MVDRKVWEISTMKGELTRGYKGKLLEKSIEAYILSLETINRLSIKYRVETFAYLICNAWELLLKAKIIADSKNRKAIYYPKKKNESLRTLSLRDCLNKIFLKENDPIRRNLELVTNLRDEAVHLFIGQIPRDLMCIFQSCVLNYHNCIYKWFELSISDYIPIGMMAIVYDFNPEQFNLANPIMRRNLGREAFDYLAYLQKKILYEHEQLNWSSEYLIDIKYKLALVKKTTDGDILLSKGEESGQVINIVEVAKDPCNTHPFRQTEVVEHINCELAPGKKITRYDIQCIVKAFNISNRPEYYYKGTIKNSPTQYSMVFVSWLMEQYRKDNNFFQIAREKVKKGQMKNRRQKIDLLL